MRKTKLILAITLAAIILGIIGTSVPALAQPDYTTLDDASAAGNAGSLKLSVDTGDDVPRFPDIYIDSVPVFGYAWVDLDTGNGVATTIHPLIGRDSHQNPDAWHTHPVSLSTGSSFDFCVASIGTSQGGLSIHNDVLRANISANQAGVSAGDLDVAASFAVQLDGGCASGLGVDVIDSVPLP